jgi:2',3'-cyclic-nucleotide 2'-phosphodiesterase (5'-nucleotidase family)
MIPQGESQEKITAAGIIDAYAKMGYDAVAVGPLDLAAGAEFLKTQDKPAFPWISANLLNTDNHPVFRPFIIKHTDQSTTGIIGLTGTTSLPANLHTGDWQTILPAQLQILAKKCNHIILLSNLPEKENYEIARQYPEIRIIISADPQFSNLSPVINNSTLITQTAQQGKYLGRLGIEWGNTSKWESGLDQPRGTSPKDIPPSTFVSQFIALQSSLPQSPAVENIVSGIRQQISRLNTGAR